MTQTLTPDVLVVGGGPGGYPAAIRAGQLGLDTVLVEADRLGGTCLIRGCIPSKAVIHAASEYSHMAKAATLASPMGISLSAPPNLDYAAMTGWKDGIVDNLSNGVAGLLKAAKVKTINGWAKFSNAKTCTVSTPDGEILIQPKNVILACGSHETEIPGFEFDGDRILSSRHVLDLTDLPTSIGIIGAGYIGLELGFALSKLGSAVTFIEAAKNILPGYDAELTRPVASSLKQHDIELLLGAKAKSVESFSNGVDLKIETAEGEQQTLSFDKVLVAVGRKPAIEGWGVETMGIDMDSRFIKVDDRCQTSMSGVFAIGDLVGEPMLAHKATAQGECVAEIISGKKRRFAPVAIPSVCFTDPEIVSVGLSPEQAKREHGDVMISKFPFAASGRAMAMDASDSKGFVRIIARQNDHVVLGIQAVGAHVAELSGEFVLALEMGAVLEDLAQTIHAHPTLSEAGAEAALAALGHPIHIAQRG